MNKLHLDTTRLFSFTSLKITQVPCHLTFSNRLLELKENEFYRFSAITCITAKLRSVEELQELQSRGCSYSEQVTVLQNFVLLCY